MTKCASESARFLVVERAWILRELDGGAGKAKSMGITVQGLRLAGKTQWARVHSYPQGYV